MSVRRANADKEVPPEPTICEGFCRQSLGDLLRQQLDAAVSFTSKALKQKQPGETLLKFELKLQDVVLQVKYAMLSHMSPVP